MLRAISPSNIRIPFTNYDIITYFLNLASCSEHFISIKHRILATFNINKNNQSERLYAFKWCNNGFESSASGHGFGPWSFQTKDYEFDICFFFAKHTPLKRKRLDGSESE